MTKLTSLVVAVVALMGVVSLVPAAASAVSGSDVICSQHANQTGTGTMNIRVKRTSVVGDVHLAAHTSPIQELGNDPQVVSAVQRYCVQSVHVVIKVTRDGHKVAKVAINGATDPNTGSMDVSKHFAKPTSPFGNDTYCVQASVFARDPDQVVAKSSRKVCGHTKVETQTIRIR